MTPPSPNYFTCTLGQAATLACTEPDQRIPEFLEEKSRNHPDLPAVGFYLPPKSTDNDVWDYRIITFRQLHNGISAIAETFKLLLSDIESSHTIALLCPSSAEFLFSWLVLVQLGHPALLIAPQCMPSAIGQLCQQLDVSVLIYLKTYEDLAISASKEARGLGFRLEPIAMPVRGETHALDMFEEAPEPSLYPSKSVDTGSGTGSDVAYLHHTSGTSSGIPKPIPQTHRGGLGVLPRLDGSAASTFTTTPLYHGGVADVFRAWTSNALIWLFPSKDRPFTAANVVKCLDIAAQASQNRSLEASIPPVKYFSSVPYVLQMLAEDPSGLKGLQNMDIVGVGGAALPPSIGDDLVRNGVNLVSRFGSAECGFLMSSHRDYEQDKEWQFLRPGEGVQHLLFEPREDGLGELVVTKGWPHMAKSNRDDGSCATADLFAPHPTIPNAWKYHSRADSQLTLVTGKKFDPAPMEAALAARSDLVRDVLIFGDGRPYPGALVFRSQTAESLSEKEIKEKLKPALDEINNESQDHTRIDTGMVTVMPPEEKPLEKSSKGTIIRLQAEVRYRDIIDKAYTETTVEIGHEDDSDEQLPEAILKIVNGIISSKNPSSDPLTLETDLFSAGVDSIASVQIRQALARLLPPNMSPLPLSLVQETGSVANLSRHILSLRRGQSVTPSQDPHTQMLDMVSKHNSSLSSSVPSSHPSSTLAPPSAPPSNITLLLTGATGSLGAHILSHLLTNPPPTLTQIHLLVRAPTPDLATTRVHSALTTRLLPIPANFSSLVSIHPCALHDPSLGLPSSLLTTLQASVTHILHLAWNVNFLQPLSSFDRTDNLGLTNLLATFTSARFIFCSSTASVSSYPSFPIPEEIISDPAASGPSTPSSGATGYARSKWVAEQQLLHASTTTLPRSSTPAPRPRITIMRVGQLSASTSTGVWSASEAYPLMLSTAKKSVVGCLPDLDKARRAQGEGRGAEELNWLPVDDAAGAFVEVVLGMGKARKKAGREREAREDLIDFGNEGEEGMGEGVEVLHVVPPPRERVKTWSSLLVALKMAEGVNIVSIDEWLGKLQSLQDTHGLDSHPALKLVDFWKQTYGVSEETEGYGSESDGGSLRGMVTHISTADMRFSGRFGDGDGEEEDEFTVSGGFEMQESLAAMPSLRRAREVDMGYVMRMWKWVKENV